MGLTDLVNTLQGSDSRMEFSTGNTYPAMGTPRGLTYWTPQTADGGFCFDRRVVKVCGFRATHSPSPWMDDYGHFDVMPVVGPIGLTPFLRASSYRINESTFRPELCRMKLLRSGADVALTATRSCAVFEVSFPPEAGAQSAIVVQTGKAREYTNGEVRVQSEGGQTRIFGKSKSHSGSVPEGFACFFVLEVEGARVVDAGVFSESGFADGLEISAGRAGAYLRLDAQGPVTVRVATSLISHEQAMVNLEREVGGKTLSAVTEEVRRQWQRWLSRLAAQGGSERDRRTFYSCLWRAGLFPMAMHEFDDNGRAVHYSPHSGRVTSGVMYTNNGFWDTYRTVYTLLGLIDPSGFGEIIDGYLAHFREGGWLPKWCSPGFRDCMIGSHSDAVVSEAILRGIEGFDYVEAYEAIRKNAFVPVEGHGRFGRRALAEYLRLGYVPAEAAPDSVSWTLDNAHCDWCIGQVAQKLSRHEEAAALQKRAGNYRNLWHDASGFMRPKDAEGTWVEPWREFEWGGVYVEGGPWQHSWHVPHDPNGLAELCGGVDALLKRIAQMFSIEPRFEVGTYGHEIHEMTEMAMAHDTQGHFGQYAHSNQPVHGVLWLPAQLGRPDISAKYVERVMRGLYSPESFPGDEDNGEMASWYLLGAIGKVPSPAGSGRTIDVPVKVFDRVEIVAG